MPRASTQSPVPELHCGWRAAGGRGSAPPEGCTDTDVLIVGAGPTGLMLANQLGRHGVRPMLIDRHRGPAEQTRAMAVHARTLEIYSKLGVADHALELGRRGYAANLWSQGTWKARVPLKDMGLGLSAFPYVLMLGQDDNERLLGAQLRRWEIVIQWQTELTALEQQTDCVLATIRKPDGQTQQITARYVAGCDGGQSTVREENGIGFPGAAYEHVFFVADTEAAGPMVDDELNVYLWRNGFHLFFPMRGADRWRVIGILPTDLSGKQNLSFNDLAPAIRHEAGADLSFRSCSWFSTYRIYHRCTDKFQDRRCFLLGDAAHVHSPMGGQGMNTGLQDAYNIAWKLALVMKGRARPALLESYEPERMKVAQGLLDTTDRAFRFLVADNWLAGILRTRVFARIVAFAMQRPRMQRLAFRTLSQIGIRYPDSPLSRNLEGLPHDAPQAGDRFPWMHLAFEPQGDAEDLFQTLDDTRFNLLVFGQEAMLSAAVDGRDLLDVHVVPDTPHNAAELDRVRISRQAFYLLRPDGHIGLAGTRWDETAATRWLSNSMHGRS